nr:unnamed protein product [Callosobruchus analis]
MFVIVLFFCSAGRGTAYLSIVVGKPNMDIEVKLILENSTNSEFLAILDIDKYKHNLRPCCNEVLERICNTSRFEESVLSQQNSELWNQERQFRITGIENDAIHFVHSCSYLQISTETGVTLKKKHSYYWQVQLGMAILNLKSCDLVLYSSKAKNFLTICVPFDEEFVRDMLSNVSKKYFNNMIHFIFENKS